MSNSRLMNAAICACVRLSKSLVSFPLVSLVHHPLESSEGKAKETYILFDLVLLHGFGCYLDCYLLHLLSKASQDISKSTRAATRCRRSERREWRARERTSSAMSAALTIACEREGVDIESGCQSVERARDARARGRCALEEEDDEHASMGEGTDISCRCCSVLL